MASFIESVLDQVKGDVAEALSPERIEQICRELNYVWRDCTLNQVTTVYAFLRQVLKTRCLACDHVPHLVGLKVTGEAYCKARARLPVELFQRLMEAVTSAVSAHVPAAWRGHRVWHLDGSACSMPDTPALQTAFGQPGAQRPGCGFPVAHLLTLFDSSTGFLLRVLPAPLRTHDHSLAPRVHEAFQSGDDLVADRGFCFVLTHLALLNLAGVLALFRIHQATIVNFQKGRPPSPQKRAKEIVLRVTGQPTSPRWVQSLGPQDQIVEAIQTLRAAEVDGPGRLRARLPRVAAAAGAAAIASTDPVFRVRQVTLVTTLLDAQRYPAPEPAKLYLQPLGGIRNNLRHLKQTLHVNALRTKTVDGISQRTGHVRHRLQSGPLGDAAAAKRQRVPMIRIKLHRRTTTTLPRDTSGDPTMSHRAPPFVPVAVVPRVCKATTKTLSSHDQTTTKTSTKT